MYPIKIAANKNNQYYTWNFLLDYVNFNMSDCICSFKILQIRNILHCNDIILCFRRNCKGFNAVPYYESYEL